MNTCTRKYARIALPSKIELRSIHESWQINYDLSPQQRITQLKEITPYQLIITGNKKSQALCFEVLKKWLKQKGHRHLSQWLTAISDDMTLPFKRLTVRGQKTCWGSCTTDRAINLNFKLLFLPATLVEYVLVHELCHTKAHNHSSQFWKLVEKFDIHYKQHRKTLRESSSLIPNWLNL